MAALTHYPNAASKAVQGMLHVEQEEKKKRSPTPNGRHRLYRPKFCPS